MSRRVGAALTIVIGIACAACDDEWHIAQALHTQSTTAAGLDELRAIGCQSPRVFAPGPIGGHEGDAAVDSADVACVSATLTCDDVAGAWATNPQRHGESVWVDVALKKHGARSCSGRYDHDGHALPRQVR